MLSPTELTEKMKATRARRRLQDAGVLTVFESRFGQKIEYDYYLDVAGTIYDASWKQGIRVPEDQLEELSRLSAVYGPPGVLYWMLAFTKKKKIELEEVHSAIETVRFAEQNRRMKTK